VGGKREWRSRKAQGYSEENCSVILALIRKARLFTVLSISYAATLVAPLASGQRVKRCTTLSAYAPF